MKHSRVTRWAKGTAGGQSLTCWQREAAPMRSSQVYIISVTEFFQSCSSSLYRTCEVCTWFSFGFNYGSIHSFRSAVIDMSILFKELLHVKGTHLKVSNTTSQGYSSINMQYWQRTQETSKVIWVIIYKLNFQELTLFWDNHSQSLSSWICVELLAQQWIKRFHFVRDAVGSLNHGCARMHTLMTKT